jgi:hypothetical protein
MTRPKNISYEDWRERKREENKKYYVNRTEEQKEYRRAYNRAYIANMTEEQKEHRRAYNRAYQEANRDKRRKNRKPRTEAEKLARKPMTPEQKVAKKAYDLAYMARLTDDERAKIETRLATYRAQNRGVIRAKSQAERDNLSHNYVKKVLGWDAEPPSELIELKRAQLKIRRYLNQGEQT